MILCNAILQPCDFLGVREARVVWVGHVGGVQVEIWRHAGGQFNLFIENMFENLFDIWFYIVLENLIVNIF